MKLLLIILLCGTIGAQSFAQDVTTTRKFSGIGSRVADTNRVAYDSLGNPLRYYQYSKLLRAGTHTLRISNKPGADNRPTIVRLSAADIATREQLMSSFSRPKTPMLQTGITLDTYPLLSHVKKADLENKIIVLVFWSNQCYPCTESFQEINSFIESVPNKDMVVLAITGNNKQTAQAKLAEFPFPAAKHLFNAANIFQAYKLTVNPTLVITDNNHLIKYAASGLSTLRPFKAALTAQLGKK